MGRSTAGVIVATMNHLGNHVVMEIKLKSEIEKKYPGLYKTLSKLKSYVKDHTSVLESLSLYSGYSNEKVLSLLSIKNLANMVKAGGTSDWGEFF